MPSFSARCIRFVFEWMLGNKARNLDPAKTRALVDQGWLHPKPFDPPRNLGADLTVERIDVTDWPLYRVSAAPAGTPTKSRPAMVYIHGGAFFAQIVGPHWKFCAQVARDTGLDVLVPIYPLLPHPKATAAHHAEGFLELYAKAPQPIVCIGGDSAGGHLSLMSMQQLVKKNPGLVKRIRCLVLISPCLDISLTHPQIKVHEARDPWLASPGLRAITEMLAGGLPLDDPRCSPLFGDIHNLPPVLMLCGTDDMICADTRRLSGKFQDKGTETCVPGNFDNDKLTYVEMPDMIHVYPLLPHWEGAEARRFIMGYIREHTTDRKMDPVK